MNARQQKVVERFGQVDTFLDGNTAAIPPASVAQQRATLDAAIAQIQSFAQDQVTKGVESVQAHTLSSARIALRDTYLRQISQAALQKLPLTPNLKIAFKLPAVKTNALTLVAAGTAMVNAAQPYSDQLIAAGLPSNFIDVTNTAIQAVQTAANAESSAKRTSKGATQGIKAQIATGHGAVRMMDVVIRPLLANNKPLLTQWDSVKRAAGGLNLGAPAPLPQDIQPITTPASTGSGASGGSSTGATTGAATPVPGTTSPDPSGSTAGMSGGTSSSTSSGTSSATGAGSAPASTPASTSGGTSAPATTPATQGIAAPATSGSSTSGAADPSTGTGSTQSAPATTGSATPAPTGSTTAPASSSTGA